MAGQAGRLKEERRGWGRGPGRAAARAASPSAVREGWLATAGRLIAIGLLYAVVTGAVLGAFMQKWSFVEYCSRFGLQEMIEGTAERPFVYRQLMPYLVRQAEAHATPAAKDALLRHLARSPRMAVYAPYTPGDQLSDACADQASPTVVDDTFRLRHALMYLLVYAALFGTLWVMHAICRTLAPDDGWAWVWPLLFALALPYTFRLGGYFYDFSEQLLLFSLLWLALKRRALPFLVVLAIAVLNKESALVFPLILAPLLIARLGWRTGMAVLAIGLAESVALTAWVREMFAANPGYVREFHLFENLDFWFSLKPYLSLGTHAASYLPLPVAANVLVLAALGYAWWRFGRHAPRLHRHTLMLALALNLPLFFVYGWLDEIRNLSLTFPALFTCLYTGWLAQRPQPGEPFPAAAGPRR